ncbi:MAG: hypothetical protein LBP20_02495 [Treponema sp.]|jgi:hypothetical protein|nr:hypothetical protein [Treponema sp.]
MGAKKITDIKVAMTKLKKRKINLNLKKNSPVPRGCAAPKFGAAPYFFNSGGFPKISVFGKTSEACQAALNLYEKADFGPLFRLTIAKNVDFVREFTSCGDPEPALDQQKTSRVVKQGRGTGNP